ncbi:MAG: YceG family protein [Clostridium sp.]|nr:YceG family protein [Clostridium sp.]
MSMESCNKTNESNTMNQRTETQAYKINEELMEILHDKESGCYKSWQFVNYKVHVDTLKTTYDEIVLWGNQESMIRPGWKIGNNEITIPNLFSKVNGIHEDVKLYREEVNKLVEDEDTLFFKRFPLYKNRFKKSVSKAYFQMLNLDGEMKKETLLTSEYWNYKKLSPVLQEAIADRIVEFCKIPDFWKHKNFKSRIRLTIFNRLIDLALLVFNREARDERLMKISIFAVLTNLDKELIELLRDFDYPMKVPKIVIYNNNKGRHMTFADAVILMFMNSMGADIVIYNPAGASDIENYVKEECYDIHRLEEARQSLPYKKNNIFYRMSRK